MSDDLISRSKLKQAIQDHFDNLDAYFPSAFIKEVEDAPTVDIKDQIAGAYNEGYACGSRENERPQGEWKRHDEWVGGEYVGGFYHVNCPCEDGYYSKWETNFCPNCGADMRKTADT